MTYSKPRIQASSNALETIQRTRKGLAVFGDSIDPTSQNQYMTQAAYEADE
jgi:hypothetical protein